MSHYTDALKTSTSTSQTVPAKLEQVKNDAGGFVFKIDCWKQLDRFLILGQEGNTYYATEKKVVMENVACLQKCLSEDGLKTVERIVEISVAGRAPKNDPAIFCLAQCAGSKDLSTRRAALNALPKVCRIGTHIFQFVADLFPSENPLRGWGRSLRNAVARWYTEKDVKSVAYQALKYQQRNGWSHRDLLRLSHPVAKNPEMNAAFRWICGGEEAVKDATKKGGDLTAHLSPLLAAYTDIQRAENETEIIRLIKEYNLPREAVPTSYLNSVAVWNALLPHMGMTAIIRNLGKMTAIGVIKPLSDASKFIRDTLMDIGRIEKERVHPMQYLLASGIYSRGRGELGKLSWTPDQTIVDALDEGFYLAFKTVVPTGKNFLVAVDVSGSMESGVIAGAPGVSPRKAAAAMAMIISRSEKNCHLVAFTAAADGSFGGRWNQGQGKPAMDPTITPFDVSSKDSLNTVMKKMEALKMGGTDCSLPMVYAEKENLNVDVFVVLTDNETYHGVVHPFQALKNYRNATGNDAKLCVVSMEANEFSIADPSDSGMLDVVGMDSHAPSILSDFARDAF